MTEDTSEGGTGEWQALRAALERASDPDVDLPSSNDREFDPAAWPDPDERRVVTVEFEDREADGIDGLEDLDLDGEEEPDRIDV